MVGEAELQELAELKTVRIGPRPFSWTAAILLGAILSTPFLAAYAQLLTEGAVYPAAAWSALLLFHAALLSILAYLKRRNMRGYPFLVLTPKGIICSKYSDTLIFPWKKLKFADYSGYEPVEFRADYDDSAPEPGEYSRGRGKLRSPMKISFRIDLFEMDAHRLGELLLRLVREALLQDQDGSGEKTGRAFAELVSQTFLRLLRTKK